MSHTPFVEVAHHDATCAGCREWKSAAYAQSLAGQELLAAAKIAAKYLESGTSYDVLRLFSEDSSHDP